MLATDEQSSLPSVAAKEKKFPIRSQTDDNLLDGMSDDDGDDGDDMSSSDDLSQDGNSHHFQLQQDQTNTTTTTVTLARYPDGTVKAMPIHLVPIL